MSISDKIPDAFAILLSAYHPSIDLLGISTVHGNASLLHTTYNATSILTAIGKPGIPVYSGAAKGLVRPAVHADAIHGESGLDGTGLLPKPLIAAKTGSAITAMANALSATPESSAWIVATGALTNVAQLFQQHPELSSHIKGLSIMGGAIGDDFTNAPMGKVDDHKRIGNWSQWAEFNILVDPEASAFLLEHPVLAKKTTLIPLDVTHLVLATQKVQDMLHFGKSSTEAIEEAKKSCSTLRRMLVDLLTFFAKTYADVFGFVAGPPLHDPLAVAAIFDGIVGIEIPFFDALEGGRRERYDVKTITEGTHEEALAGAQTGRTIATLLPEGEEGVKIPRGLNVSRFWDVLEECLVRADEVNKGKGFRKLVNDTPARQSDSPSSANKVIRSRNGTTPSALGSRMRSSIPMTPRTVAGYSNTNSFARQLAERNASVSGPSVKKFRSAAVPKGAKLADGYTDRAKQLRTAGDEEGEENDKVTRVKASEEMMKLQQIDEPTFVKLRDEILGDQIKDRAKLVKGLDWRLLERVRRGEVGVEDVLEGSERENSAAADENIDEDTGNIDDEFDRLEEMEVESVIKEREKKTGEMAPPGLTGKKRNRNQILADLKATRKAAKEAATPSLGAKFKKVGERRAESRIERDGKGREVLITIDEHGNEKRKVRKVQVEEPVLEKGHGLLMPDKDAKPMGMEVPEIPQSVEEEKEINIFDDVDDEYDPLAGLEDDDSEDDAEKEEGKVANDSKNKSQQPKEPVSGSMAPPPRPAPSRNYFNQPSKPSPTPSDSSKPAPLSDPTLLAALRKASSLNLPAAEPSSIEEAAKEARRKKMLEREDRDAQDMDMGFGSSRFADEEDFEEKKVKLSEWGSKGGTSDGEGHGKSDGKVKRKRGPKKRKGDANSAADVLKVIERRKASDS
ncbi:inosine-uridine preferring nucleoside hydrolase [Diplocarpon rosae]|nr:inosine-uridine preferring nucleoside hydrolase [Diplocarpon rosae]